MTPNYAVTAGQQEGPIAIFTTFEDALAWATLRFGYQGFQIDEVFTRIAPPNPRAQLVPA
jgi:hypothetical protein